MTNWLVRVVTIFLLGSVVGCAAPAAPAASATGAATTASSGPKRIVAVIRGDPVTLATAIDEAGAGKTPGLDQVEMMLNAGLGAYDAKSVLQPLLAEQVPTVDNGQWVVNADGTMRT